MGWGCWANYISIQLNPIILLGAQSKYLLKNGHVQVDSQREIHVTMNINSQNKHTPCDFELKV